MATTSTTATDYGRDLSGVEDITYQLLEVLDSRLGVAQAIGRRLMCEPLFYDPDYGYDLRQQLSAAVQPELVGEIEHRVEEEALKDERVEAATATVNLNGETLEVRLQIATYEDGPFELTLEASALTVSLLSVG